MRVFVVVLALALFAGLAVAQTIRVAGGAVGQELELTRAGAERYMEENPDVTVEVVEMPDGADERMSVYLQLFEAQSGDVDVFQIDVIWPGDLAEHFVDLYEYGADEVVDQHFEGIVQNNTVDGELVGLPWFTDGALLYYRTDLLDEYGFDGPPETWGELEEMARTIQEGEREAGNDDFWGYVWQGDAYEGLTVDALEWVASHGGGTIVSPDGVVTINNPAAVRAVERAADWVDTISPSGVTSFKEEDARNFWQAGNAAFMRNWPYAYSLGQEEDSEVAGRFDVTTLPAAEGHDPATVIGGWQLAVSRYSENPELAADVAKFLTSYEEQKTRAIEGSMTPTIEELYEDEEVLDVAPYFSQLREALLNATARPSTVTAPNYADVSRAFSNAVHDVLTGSEDADVALEILELDLQDITGFPAGDPQ